MVHKEGLISLWRGLIPTMLRDVPFSAIYWMMYEELKHKYVNEGKQSRFEQFQFSFFAGATSGTVKLKKANLLYNDWITYKLFYICKYINVLI